MPLMRDKASGVVREVGERWLKRWPEEYEPVKKTKGPKRLSKTATAETNETGGETEGEAS